MIPVEFVFDVVGCLIIFVAGFSFLRAWFAQRRMRQGKGQQQLDKVLYGEQENES